MCGILGYIGENEAYPFLLKGLERLEYRGYDSTGICTSKENKLFLNKKEGRVQQLAQQLLPGNRGIAHTRWATHGHPADRNAHPFTDTLQEFVVVHNGIIENYLEIKEQLRKEGVVFTSDTDSEVIVHLIAKYYQKNMKEGEKENAKVQGSLITAVRETVKQLVGTYAFCVLKNDAEEIVAARNGSPLLIGLGKRENFFASDARALIEHTKEVIYVNDFEIARIDKENIEIVNFQGEQKTPQIKILDGNIQQEQKQGYKHFMLKEIFEQPEIFESSFKLPIRLPALFSQAGYQALPKKIIIVACGTASYAGLLGKYFIEKIARIPVENVVASEFRYQDPLLTENDLIIAISQSGETADTLAAVRLAKEKGVQTLGIINVRESTIAREVQQVHYTQAGPEIGVASTKAFFAQIATLLQFAYVLKGKTNNEKNFEKKNLQEKIRQVLELNKKIKVLAEKYWTATNFLYIGRNLNYPLALEGALKLKEISYIHAEAYPGGELKHGPLALVSEETPTFALCPQDGVYEKMLSNIAEIKARKGKVIALATEGDEKIKELVDDVIFVPKVDALLYPFVCIIPLQLFAYHIADRKGCDVDKPRNLAKSVTVE